MKAKAQGFVRVLDEFAEWCAKHRPDIKSATIHVTASTARRKLKIKKNDPLVYRGLTLRCIGSKRYRNKNGPQI